jgi:hypothetical protein
MCGVERGFSVWGFSGEMDVGGFTLNPHPFESTKPLNRAKSPEFTVSRVQDVLTLRFFLFFFLKTCFSGLFLPPRKLVASAE